MMFFRLLLPLALASVLGACSSVPRIVTEYRIDIQQGNVLTQEMVSNLRPGLSRDQVRFILGTPMLADVFHADRWDYVYRLKNGKTGDINTRRLSVYFDKDGKLASVAGDVEAASNDELGQPVSRMQVVDLGTVTEGQKPPPPPEKGFFGRMMEKIGF